MCIRDYIESELDQNNVKILCPENGCRKVLNENDVKRIANHYQGGKLRELPVYATKCQEQIRSVLQEERKECIICTESVNIIAFLNITDQCSHDRRICRECVGEYIKHELEDNGKLRISCPEDNCNEILNQKDVKEFASDDVFKRQHDEEEYTRQEECRRQEEEERRRQEEEERRRQEEELRRREEEERRRREEERRLATLRTAETASESYV
ncbi:3091_t:CDS:2, partial [Racocetra fulgida]